MSIGGEPDTVTIGTDTVILVFVPSITIAVTVYASPVNMCWIVFLSVVLMSAVASPDTKKSLPVMSVT